MLDTVVLTLDRRHFEIIQPERFSPSAKGLLSPPYYPLGSGGSIACVQNPTKADLNAGRYLPRLTLSKRKISAGFALTLRIQFSAPKLHSRCGVEVNAALAAGTIRSACVHP